MARQKANVEYNQFQSGLVTEGNILNLPVDSFREGENFILTRNNTWERRKGLELEHNGKLVDSYSSLSKDSAVGVHEWHTHYSELPEIIVIQLGEKLHFFDSSVTPLSDGKLLVNGQEYLTTEGASDASISSSSVEGIFVYTTYRISPKTIQITGVDRASDDSGRYDVAVEEKELILATRDVWGRLTPSKKRPTELTNDLKYDLINQGWDSIKWAACFQATKEYPNSHEVWWLYKNTHGEELDKFNASLMKDPERSGIGQGRQNTPAPRGSTITTLNQIASGKPTVIQSYAGRIFYSGFDNTPRVVDDVRPDFGNYVFFSQLVKSNPDIAKCYQFSDPTSEKDSELVDTDGGFIKVNAARNIVALEEVSTGLLVIAENGVWIISGTDAGLFSATGYKVDKVCDFGCVSSTSIIAYGDSVFYWAEDGIIALVPDKTTGKHIAQNVTEQRIQSLYDDIETSNKRAAVGAIERSDKYLRWLYSTGSNPSYFDTEIVLNLNGSAFFINTIKSDENTEERLIGYVPERNIVTNIVSNDYYIVVGADRVLAGESEVTIGLAAKSGDEKYNEVKYLTGVPSNGEIGFYQYSNTDYKDFNDVDAEAYLISAPQKLDDTQRRKQITSLATHMARTDTLVLDDQGVLSVREDSSMTLRVRWDYTDMDTANKWTRPRECYRYRRPFNLKQGDNVYPYKVITARERIRGSGTAFQFEFRTEPEKDCKLLGWAVTTTGGTDV